MKLSTKGLDLIKRFEGCALKAYKCPAGVWTIGYGHTGPDVTAGLTITQSMADDLLKRDVARFERGVFALVGDTTQGRFDALVSFAFNLGLGALSGSTLIKLHKAANYALAADQFKRWNKAGGRVLTGLVKRRAAEREVYLS